MRPDEFDEALDLLPTHLRERAEALRPHVIRGRCDQCREIADEVELALMAARYGEHTATEQLIGAAERRAGNHTHAGPHLYQVRDRSGGNRPGRRGVVAHWAGTPGPLVAATDASWKDRTHGIGYLASNGHFGLHGWPLSPLDPSGPSRVLIDELRAVEFLLSGLTARRTGMTVLVDSVRALSYLHHWQAGDTALMPAGYSLRPRVRAAQPTLVRLAERLADLPGVTFQHVKSHTGHPLNEAADALSRMARRRVREPFDLRNRAKNLVDAFLCAWHTAASADTWRSAA